MISSFCKKNLSFGFLALEGTPPSTGGGGVGCVGCVVGAGDGSSGPEGGFVGEPGSGAGC